MINKFQSNPEFKQTPRDIAKVVTMFIKNLSKPAKLWRWAYDRVKKMNNNKKLQQNGEIVDMNVISFSIASQTFIERKLPTELVEKSSSVIRSALQKKFKMDIEAEIEKIEQQTRA